MCVFEELKPNLVQPPISDEYKPRKYAKSIMTDESPIDPSTELMDCTEDPIHFPLAPPSKDLMEKIINGFCSDSKPAILQESGCAVCGLLNPTHELQPLLNFEDSLHILRKA